MHVLWLTEHGHPGRGGMATSSERIIAGLRRAGVRLDVVQFTGGADEIERHVEVGGERLFAPMGDDAEHGLNLLWASLRAHARPWTHIVAFGGHLPVVAGPVLAAWIGRPLVMLMRGNDFDTAVFHPQRRAALADAFLRSARVITVSQEMCTRAQALFPAAAVSAVANGIAMHHWQALPSDRANATAWRTRTVEQGRNVIGMFGQIKAKKGGLLLLEALIGAGLADRIHLLFVGVVDQLVTDFLEANPVLHVSFAEPVDRTMLIPHYLACDAIALPSLYDGMPNVLLEAGALGVPVIAARAGGIPDVIQDDTQGWLFEPGDREACASAIAAFLAAPLEARLRTGLNLRKRIAVEFTEEREIRALLDALHAAGGNTVQLATR